MRTSVRRHVRRIQSGQTDVRQHYRSLNSDQRGITVAKKDISKQKNEQYLKDVTAGKILNVNRLKLSEMQSLNKPPKYENYYSKEEGVYAREDSKPIPEYDGDDAAKKYKKGLVLKISGDYDPDLSERHNEWATVTKVIDPYHFEVKTSEASRPIVIRDTDVKWWIGDKKYDYIGIGKQRWKDEIVPMTKITAGDNPKARRTAMKQTMKDFNRGRARALSETSLKRPLTDAETKRFKQAFKDSRRDEREHDLMDMREREGKSR